MGNEMGNNNTSAIKEEENITETEEKTLLQDTSELQNGVSQNVDADIAKEKNQPILTSTAKDVMEKAEEAYNDATTEPGKDTWQEDNHADIAKEENQPMLTSTAKNVMEKAEEAYNDAATEPGKDTRQEDNHEDDVKGKIQKVSTAESKDVQETVTCFASKNTGSMHSLEGDTRASDMSMENQMYPTTEAEHVQEKPTVLASDSSAIEHGKVTIQDVYAVDMKEKIHMIPTGEAKDVQEEATGLISNNTASILENDSLEGDTNASNVSMENQMHPEAEAKDQDVQEKPTGLESEYTTINSLEKDTLKGDDAHAEDINVDQEQQPTAEGKDDQEIAPKLSFDDKTSEPQEKHQEDKHDADVVIPMAHGTDVHGKDTILASDDPLNLRTSFGGAVHDITEARQPEKSPNTGSVEAEGENHEILSSSSLEGTEECENRKESCLTKPVLITYDLLDNDPSIKQDNTLKSDHEDNSKVLCEESTMGYSYDYSLDHGMEETLEDFKASMVSAHVVTIGSNGESNTVLASDVSWIANTNKVEGPKVSEGGLQLDAHVNNCKASEETNFVSEPKHSVVPETEIVSLIGGSTNVDCKHESGENYKIKMEETNGKLEASYANMETSEGTEMSEQYDSGLVTINQEEYFTLQNSSSLLHIYDSHEGNVKQIKSFTAIGMPDSDWKQTNDTFDSSNSTAPSLDLVNDEAFETEGEIYTQYIEATSLKGAELTTSVASMSSEVPCLNNSMFASGGYETREIATRVSTESESDNPNISQMQKSPSFNLNLRVEARPEESDQAPLLYQEKFSNERMSNQTNLMPNAEYGQCMLQNEEMPVEEKIVTMERSYSEKSKANLVVMPETQDSHSGTKKDVKEESSTSPIGKEKHKKRSSFFSSFMCCATLAN